LQSAVWSVLVVVAAADTEDVLEMAATEDENSVEAVGANRAYPTLGEGVAFGAWTGVRITLIPSARKDLVEDATEFRVAIMDEEPKRLLVTNCMTRLRGDGGAMGCARGRSRAAYGPRARLLLPRRPDSADAPPGLFAGVPGGDTPVRCGSRASIIGPSWV
jgi:hypothetical protein